MTGRTSTLVSVVAIGVGGVFAVAGCSAAGHSAAGQPSAPAATSPGTTPATGTAGPTGAAQPQQAADPAFTARLPIAAYAYTDAQIATIDAGVDVLTDRCMRGYGMSYQAPPKPPPPARTSADRRYGISSAYDAAHYGYHLPPDQQSPLTPAPAARSGTAHYLVLYGRKTERDDTTAAAPTYQGRAVPPGGCRGEAVAEMGNGFADPSGSNEAAAIADGSYTASMRDPEVRAATEKWSACMKRRGYDYATPLTSLGDKDFLGEATAPREIATAKADMSCKKTTDLLNVWFSAESRIQRGMIAGQAQALNTLRQVHAAKAAAARKIVSAG